LSAEEKLKPPATGALRDNLQFDNWPLAVFQRLLFRHEHFFRTNSPFPPFNEPEFLTRFLSGGSGEF
jgi:hypothetical protein